LKGAVMGASAEVGIRALDGARAEGLASGTGSTD